MQHDQPILNSQYKYENHDFGYERYLRSWKIQMGDEIGQQAALIEISNLINDQHIRNVWSDEYL